MEGLPLLSLPEGLYIMQIQEEATAFTISVISTRPCSYCPLCAGASSSVHSHYSRTVRDVPCGGHNVRLHLAVRKFFCRNPDCQRKIFTERLPDFVEPWAQMTPRLVAAIQAIGLATSGSLGARLAARLGIVTSWMTILRRIMALPTPAPGAVTALGIDDFSFKRGRKFGTILVDLDLHRVIDVLAERSSQSSADWMREHPEITYVSRDRGKDYSQGASEGAPQATQISDRFHLMQNFVKAVEAEVERCYKHIHQAHVALTSLDLPDLDVRLQTPDGGGADQHQERSVNKQEQFEQVKDLLAHGVSAAEIANQLAIPIRRVYRWKAREECPAADLEPTGRTDHQERFEQAKALRLRGCSYKHIAERLAVGVRTVQRWMARESGPYCQPRRKRQSIFDPYAPYVLSRWQQGERSIDLIWSEIHQQGFKGSKRTLYRFVRSLRQGAQELRIVGNNTARAPLPASRTTDRISVQKAIWLLVRPYENLKTDERKDLQDLCEMAADLSTLHILAQSFGQMVRKREGHRLSDWISLVKESSFRHIKRFVAGLQRDKEEVLAGLTRVYSNGQVEGFVNKLKLIKRQGYGRANYPLLRQRMLHAL